MNTQAVAQELPSHLTAKLIAQLEGTQIALEAEVGSNRGSGFLSAFQILINQRTALMEVLYGERDETCVDEKEHTIACPQCGTLHSTCFQLANVDADECDPTDVINGGPICLDEGATVPVFLMYGENCYQCGGKLPEVEPARWQIEGV